MKWLFVLLLTANLAFWGYTRLAQEPVTPDWKSREVNGETLKLSKLDSAPPPPATEAPATEASPPTASDTRPTEAAPVSTAAPAAGAAACLNWRGIAPGEIERARQKLAPLKLGTSLEVLPPPEGPVRYWVYVPPRESAEDAQKKVAEYQRLGVSDFFAVNDGGRWQNAISLGLYSTQEAADRRLAGLRDKGVRSAIIRERNDILQTATLRLRGVPAERRAELEELAKGFRGSVIVENGCPPPG